MFYKYTTPYGEYNVTCVATRYCNNDSLAVSLITDEGEPFATATVNLPESGKHPNRAFLDTNNCPGINLWLTENGFGFPTGIMGFSGYCMYPEFEFNLEKLETI